MKRFFFTLILLAFAHTAFATDRYVSSLAPGGGSGTSGSPWTLAESCSSATAKDIVHVKADGNYDTAAQLTISNAVTFLGYTTSIADGGKATIRAITNSNFSLFTVGSNQGVCFDGMVFKANGQTGITVVNLYGGGNGGNRCVRCQFFGTNVEQSGSNSLISVCYFEDATCTVNNGLPITDCVFKSTTGGSYNMPTQAHRCIGWNVGVSTNTAVNLEDVVVFNTSGNGFNFFGGSVYGVVRRCVAVNCGGYGFGEPLSPSPNTVQIEDCFAYNNAGGQFLTAAFPFLKNATTLTSNPFTNASAGDFSLTSTAGGGASLRALNYTMPGLSNVSYRDAGPIQHQDSGGGGTSTPRRPVIRIGGY